jgi:hypothetical protein
MPHGWLEFFWTILKPILEKNGVFGKSNDKFYTDIKTQWKVWSGDNI